MVSINSDDPHLFGIDLCHEYEVVHNELDLTLEDFNRINDHAAACSFLPPEEKQKVWPQGDQGTACGGCIFGVRVKIQSDWQVGIACCGYFYSDPKYPQISPNIQRRAEAGLNCFCRL